MCVCMSGNCPCWYSYPINAYSKGLIGLQERLSFEEAKAKAQKIADYYGVKTQLLKGDDVVCILESAIEFGEEDENE